MGYRFVEQDTGPIRIYKPPEPGMVYTMGVDASTGLAEDYTSVQVLSNSLPFEQVGVFRAKWPVNEVSKYVDMIGRYYNEALNVCEINYPGNSVQDALLQFYKYPRNYMPESHLKADMDIEERYGLRTTDASKWLLINEMQMAIGTGDIIIHDDVTIDEMMNFVYIASKRKTGAADGFNDDTVMALMFAYHGAKLYPCVRPPTKKKQEVRKSQDPDTIKSWELFKKKLRTPRNKSGVIM